MSENQGAPPDMPAEWFASIRDQRVGPLTIEQVAQMVREAGVHPHTLFWKKGMDEWMPARQVSELAPLFTAQTRATGGGVDLGQMKAYSRIVGRKAMTLMSNTTAAKENNSTDFLLVLFDRSFSSFITSHVIKSIYLIVAVLGGLGALGATLGMMHFIGGNSEGSTLWRYMLILLPPFAYLFMLTIFRIILELIIVTFQIADYTRQTAIGVTRMTELKAEPKTADSMALVD